MRSRKARDTRDYKNKGGDVGGERGDIENGWVEHYRQNIGIERIQVDKRINAGTVEGGHTAGVVRVRVDMIHTDSVCAQGLHQSRISSALFGIYQRVV
jgi:hypothetical protein